MPYHILIVEDEPDTRELLDVMLRLGGHHVDVAQGGREALDRLALQRYDIILTDLHMPGMSGEDLYRHIEHHWPDCASRVVFVTAAPPGKAFRPKRAGQPSRSSSSLTHKSDFSRRSTRS